MLGALFEAPAHETSTPFGSRVSFTLKLCPDRAEPGFVAIHPPELLEVCTFIWQFAGGLLGRCACVP